VIKNTFGNR